MLDIATKLIDSRKMPGVDALIVADVTRAPAMTSPRKLPWQHYRRERTPFPLRDCVARPPG